MTFYFIWAPKRFMKRHIHFPAGKFMCALSPRADCGLRLCLWHSYSPFILLQCTGGLSPSTAPESTMLGAVQRWFEDPPSFSLCKCPGTIVLGTEGHTPFPHGVQTVHVQVVIPCISVVSWRDRRRIRAAQKRNHSQSLALVPPLSALSTARPSSRATPFSLHWVLGSIWASETLPHLLGGACLRTTLNCVKWSCAQL